jgi:predicted dehydrogenase
MKNSKIKFGVVGCGNIGKRHLQVINDEKNAELVSLCDIDENICKKYSEMYSVPYFTNYLDLLESAKPEIVCICTPHGLHSQMSIDAAFKKINILVEKPMALSVDDCHKMIKAAQENNVKLFVVKQNRYNKPIAITKEALDGNKLGKIYMVQCNVLWNRNVEYYIESDWRGKKLLEGGALHTQVCHFIDLLIWWFGEIIEAKTNIETRHHNIEIEDCGISNVKFESGVIGSIMWTTTVYNTNFEGSITIIGEKGTIKIGGKYLNKIDFWDVKSYPLPEGYEFEDKPNVYGKYQGTSSNHDKLIHDLVIKFSQNMKGVVEGTEGIKTVKAIELMYKNI